MASLPDHLMPAPVGREPLPREVLEQHQRDRVLAAAVGVFAEHGFQAATVEHLVAAARIGVGTFYALFSGKEECFLALYDRVVVEAGEEVAAAVPADAPWAERAGAGLRAVLELVAAEPDRALVVIVEAQRAGTAAERRYTETTTRLAAALSGGRGEDGTGEGPPPSFEQAAVAGLAWALGERLEAGEPVVVAELLPEMESFLTAPFEGV